ncbi:MAG: hypothetical protein J6Q93_00320 [Prevotella sp.]|nr:hypothetical protein [Prevotella sp.]
MEKQDRNTKGLTAADVINSDVFKRHCEEHLTLIRDRIKEAIYTLKAGERLKSTTATRLNKLGLLETEAFTNAYACIVAKTPIPLPATLRNAIKEYGDIIFVASYTELSKPDRKEQKDE